MPGCSEPSRAGAVLAMAGMAETLAKQRAVLAGEGRHGRAVPYLGQHFGALRQECLQQGRLFQDPSFPAGPAALGYRELGPRSHKTQGVVWRRPTVGRRGGGIPGGMDPRWHGSPAAPFRGASRLSCLPFPAVARCWSAAGAAVGARCGRSPLRALRMLGACSACQTNTWEKWFSSPCRDLGSAWGCLF